MKKPRGILLTLILCLCLTGCVTGGQHTSQPANADASRPPTMGQHNTAEPTQSNSDNTGAVSDAAPQQSDDQPASSAKQSSAKQSSAKQESTAPVMTGYLPRGDAIQIALHHAGVAQADICDLSCKLEEENGVMIYQVEFEHGQYEYEYEIDAKSGKILDVDIDD